MKNIYRATLGRILAEKKRRRIAAAVLTALCLAAAVLAGMFSLQSALAGTITPGANSVDVTLSGTKIVEGAAAQSQSFTFQIERWTTNDALTGQAHADQSLVQGKDTVTVPTSGAGTYDITFPTITFPSPGPNNGDKAEYHFRITETTGGGAGWTNDATAKIVSVSVQRDRYSNSRCNWNELIAAIDYDIASHDPFRWESPDKNHPFGSANYYGVFVLGNATINAADVEGGMAVGGNYNQTGYFEIGLTNRSPDYSPPSWPIRPYSPRTLVKGNLTVSSSNLISGGGSVVIGTGSTLSGNVYQRMPSGASAAWDYTWYSTGSNFPGTTTQVTNSNVLKEGVAQFFTDADRELTALSDNYRSAATAGKTLVVDIPTTAATVDFRPGTSNDDTGYAGYDTIIYNYNAGSGTNITTSNEFNIVFPTDFKGNVVINYNSTAAQLNYGTHYTRIYSGATVVGTNSNNNVQRYYSGRITWNFPSGLTKITLGPSSSWPNFIGGILAPNTDVSIGTNSSTGGGTIVGNAVCRNYSQYGQSSEQHNTTLFSLIKGQVVFTNTYSASNTGTANATVNGRKTVTGGPSGSKTFTFRITRVTDATGGTPTPSPNDYTATQNAAVTGDGSQTFSFSLSGLPRPSSGSTPYYYKVTEEMTTAPGWTYSGNVYLVTVVVPSGTGDPSVTYTRLSGEDGDGTTEINGPPEFINKYNPGTANATVNGRKTVTGGPSGSKTFTFRITRVTDDMGGTPTPSPDDYTDTQTAEVTENGSQTFSFSLSGLPRPSSGSTAYYYKIVEEMTTAPGWTYSGNVYLVTVVVPSGTGDPSVTYTRLSGEDGDGTTEPGGPPEFINKYIPPTYPAAIPVTKTLIGTPDASKTFTFTLTHTNGSGEAQGLPAGVTINGASSSPQSVSIPMSAQGNSPFQFDLAGLTASKTYYFTLMETTGGSGGPGAWSNDATNYLIEVKMETTGTPTYRWQSSTAETPTWSATWTNGLPATPNSGRFTFRNNYTSPVNVQISAVKNTEGAPMTAEQFTFALYEIDENDEILREAPLTAKNADAGESASVSFPPLTFTVPGNYVYYLTETGDEPGWIMDSTSYRIVIIVDEDNSGNLFIEAIRYIEADDTGAAIQGKITMTYDESSFATRPNFRNIYAGPRFPEVGGIGKDTVAVAGLTIIATISMLFGGALIYWKSKRRKQLARQ